MNGSPNPFSVHQTGLGDFSGTSILLVVLRPRLRARAGPSPFLTLLVSFLFLLTFR